MTISGDYSIPVTVNGYQCRNCTDVSLAQKDIDPAHPKSGPGNVDARHDPSQPIEARIKLARADADKLPAAYAKPGVAVPQPGAGAVFDLAA